MKATVKVLSVFEGLKRTTATEALAGEIVAIAGIEDVDVGDTIADTGSRLGGARPAAHPRGAADHQDAHRRQHLALRRQEQADEVPDEPPPARAPPEGDEAQPRHSRRGQRDAGHVRRPRPRRAAAGDPRRDDAARGLRDAARQPRGRDQHGRRRALRADGDRGRRHPRAVHRRRDRAPRRAARAHGQDVEPRLRPRAHRVSRPQPRDDRPARRDPDGDARHRPPQLDLRRLGALGRPDDEARDGRHRLRSRRRGDAVRAAPPSAARLVLPRAGRRRCTRA